MEMDEMLKQMDDFVKAIEAAKKIQTDLENQLFELRNDIERLRDLKNSVLEEISESANEQRKMVEERTFLLKDMWNRIETFLACNLSSVKKD